MLLEPMVLLLSLPRSPLESCCNSLQRQFLFKRERSARSKFQMLCWQGLFVNIKIGMKTPTRAEKDKAENTTFVWVATLAAK